MLKIDRNLALLGSTHSVHSPASIAPDSTLLSRILNELQGSLGSDTSSVFNERQSQVDSSQSVWIPYSVGPYFLGTHNFVF